MQPAEWIRFIAQFAQLSRRQRQAGVAQPRLACPACHSPHLHRHGDALSAELSGLALDTRCQAHPFTRNVIESNAGGIPTSDGDIALKYVAVRV
jgi:hypothetical protein